MAQASTYAPSYNRLEVDGVDVGPLRSAQGGDPYGEVVQAPVRAGNVTDKRIAGVHYADIAIECGLAGSGPLAGWITAMLGGPFVRHGGAIVEYDRQLQETSRLTFQNATIDEVQFPAMDATRQDPAYLTVRLAPEWTQRQSGSGAVSPNGSGTTPGAPTKQSRSCDFELQIDGLVATNVIAIEPLVVRQVTGVPAAGEERFAEAPTWLEIGDLVVTLPEAADWYAWRDAFIVAGTGPERSGRLDYFSPDRKDVLARIEFSGLGLYGLARERSDDGVPPAIRHMRASMYCESLTFGLPPPAAPAPGDPLARFTPRSRVDVTVPLTFEPELARPPSG